MARRLASISATADYLSVGERTVRRMISDGQLTGYRVGKHLIRIDLDEVDQQLCQRIPAATSGR